MGSWSEQWGRGTHPSLHRVPRGNHTPQRSEGKPIDHSCLGETDKPSVKEGGEEGINKCIPYSTYNYFVGLNFRCFEGIC